MKISDFLQQIHEDIASDNEARKIAQIIADKLFQEVKEHEYKNFTKVNSDTIEAYYISITKLFDYRLDVVPTSMRNSKIIIRYENHTVNGVSGGVDSRQNVHIFLGTYTNKRLALNEFPILKSTVVHEIIHILDGARLKGKTKDSVVYATQGDYKSYANDPMELNAHYQQMIHNFEERLQLYKSKPDTYHIVFDSFLSSPEKFIEHVLSMLDYSYINALTVSNLTKFKKRLYQYYKHIETKLQP